MHPLRLAGLGLLTTTIISTAAPTLAATDGEIDALKAQLEAVTKRLAELEAEQKQTKKDLAKAKQVKVVTSDTKEEVVTAGKLPNSFKLPGTDTSVKIGGFVKMDGIYDANHAYGGQFGNFATIPLDNSAQANQDAEFNAHARNSRVNFTTLTPTEIGDLKTFVEVDFFGTDRGNPNTTNGSDLQLRHAYGQVGRVLAGQTWSNFMDLDAYPESLDYVGPVGLSFVRQAQVRYTDKIDDNWSYAMALEAPQTSFTPTAGTKADLSEVPDFTARAVYKDDFGHLAFRGLARVLDANDTAIGNDDEAFGWGLGFSGKLKTFGKDTFSFSGVYGDGLGHYLLESAVTGNGSTYVNGDLDTQTVYGGYVDYMHAWTDAWRSNLIFGYSGMDNDVNRTGLAINKEVMSSHINLLWNPVPQYKAGIEYIHAYRELESGVNGELDRFQASFIYSF